MMIIRAYQPSDEGMQVAIYNEAAAHLPSFKPTSMDEVRRRTINPQQDQTTRFFALEGDAPVGYIACQAGGRLGFPWCRKGYEHLQGPLLDHALGSMRDQGLPRAIAAFRPDWTSIGTYFQEHGFEQKREMLNYQMNLFEMPTASPHSNQQITSFTEEDLPEVLELARPCSLGASDEVRKQSWLHNPWFSANAFFLLRNPNTGRLDAIGVLVANPNYANASALDGNMPCFRLGAFGTEGMSWKRINGLFSFLVRDPNHVSPLGLDLMKHASSLLEETEVETVSAQVCSDVPHLVHFYKQYFQLQGRFPLFERSL